MLEINQLMFNYQNVSNKVLSRKAPESMEMCFDLHVNTGEILSIVGSSGSGKTTLLNLIAGFIQPLSGNILVNGTNINKLSVAKRPVTTVFQEHNLFPHLDTFTNVAIGINPSMKLTRGERNQVEQSLESVGLANLTQRLPKQLSGGQRQRVALARALVRKHKVLLLDEPLAALGPAMREEIIELIKTLVDEQNMTALFVSHQPSDALLASEHCAFIHKGKVLELTTTESLLNNPTLSEMKSEVKSEIKDYLGG